MNFLNKPEFVESSVEYLDEKLELEHLAGELLKVVRQNKERYIRPSTLRKVYRNFSEWRKIFEHHYSWKKPGKRRKKVFEYVSRVFVHYLIERCYWIRYGDTDIVNDLLMNLFLLDGHLGKIFNFQQLSVKRRQKIIFPDISFCRIRSTWTEEILSKETTQPFQYFLEHSNKKKTLFSGQRLIEKYYLECIYVFHKHAYQMFLPPCSQAFHCPQIFGTLLHYGLFAECGPHEEDPAKVLTGIIGMILISNSADASNHTLHIIEIGNLLLRAVDSVSMASLLKRQQITNRKEFMKSTLHQLTDYLPMLETRCWGPQELQHICRRRIRRTLYHNWNLPIGIEMLPIPRPLKEYINLERD